ncbi:Rib/alpha-like domain-containing protein [Parvimonas parva]|uniref:Bacterial Ig-like domain-containing protein n=1 Tax=Parvimonas parva TaxID=2769485 RepID=A0ABS1C9Z1_9FIRM|nr:Rib/alpha-like domain-containing protein [Parvimonas parva]MBK1468880.1 bacterial Ig-like domain-containing protein [Parvimonas parva]
MKNLLKVILRKRQNGNKKPKWGMRKLSKGLVSCLLGFSMLISLTTNVYAKVAWGTDGEGVNPLKRAKFYNVKEGTVLPADKYPTATATTPAKPKINDVTENDKTISGKGIPRAKVNITKENADKSGQGTEIAKDVEVRNDGTWTAKVPDGVTLTKGDIIYATQNVDGKNFSDQAEATVKAADTQVEAPTLKANDDGSVTVTPPTDKDIDGVLIEYTDEKNHQGTLAVTNDEGQWKLPDGTDPSIKIDKTTGVVTIPANQVKDESEVKAWAEKNSIHSDEVKVNAKNNPVTKKEITKWVQEIANGTFIDLKKPEKGNKSDKGGVSDFPGYEFVRTEKTENDTTITYTNVYKILLGSKAVGLDGQELKKAAIGYNKEKVEEFTGYTFLFDEAGSTPSNVQGKKAYLVSRIYAKNPAVVEVKNTNSLTSDEQKAVKVAVKTANPNLLDKQISVDKKGEVTIKRGDRTAKLASKLTVVKKGQKDAEKNDPKGQDISAKVGDTLKPEDGIKNKGDLINVKSYTFKDPVDTKTPGKKDAVVVVKYNDGSEDKVDVKVNVKAWKDFFTAKGGELVVSKGTAVKAHDVYEKVKLIYKDNQTFGVNDKNNILLPIGNKSNAWLYVDSNKLPTKDSKAGQYTRNVFINYPDGSKQIVQVIVKVVEGQTDADKYTPTADAVEKEKGTAVTEKDVIDAVKVPGFKENPKFPGQTPKVTVDDPTSLPDGNTVGKTDVAVTVTYPDGSTDKLTVPVTVKDTTPTEKEFDKEKIAKIEITTPPTKTTYTEGEKFDPAGMEVTLTDENGKTVDVPAGKFAEYGITVPTENLTKDQTKVEVKAKDKKAEQAITVKEKEVVPKINRTGMPVINNAKAGDEKITGTAEPGATLTVTTPEGVKTVVAGADGKWEITLGTPLAEGNVIKAVAKVNGKGASNEASITVGKAKPISDQVTPAVPKEKTPVENPTNLTKEEKETVKKKVEEANKGNFPSGTKVEIGSDGTATITYPDNSQDKIKGSDLVVKKKVVSKKPTNKKLPKTSITGTGLSGVMIGLAGIGLSVLKKNKRED